MANWRARADGVYVANIGPFETLCWFVDNGRGARGEVRADGVTVATVKSDYIFDARIMAESWISDVVLERSIVLDCANYEWSVTTADGLVLDCGIEGDEDDAEDCAMCAIEDIRESIKRALDM